MTRVDFPAKFDYHARIIPVDKDHMKAPNICMDKEHSRVYEKQVELLLSKCLGDRAHLVRVLHRSIPENWHIDEGLACLGKVPLLVGILISDFEKAIRMIDVGPSADNKIESAKFRSLGEVQKQLQWPILQHVRTSGI